MANYPSSYPSYSCFVPYKTFLFDSYNNNSHIDFLGLSDAVYIEQDKESYSSHDVKQKLAKEYALLPLMRYEIHLDRKLERVLSVYYKLKELGSSPNHQS